MCKWFQAIDEFKKGKVEFRVDKTGIAHIPFGKVNFPEEDLIANFMAVVVRYLLLKTSLLLPLSEFMFTYLLPYLPSAPLRGTSHLVQRGYTGKRHMYAHQWDLQSS